MAFYTPPDLTDPMVFFDHYLWHLYDPEWKYWDESQYECSDEDKKKYKEIGDIIFRRIAHSDPETLRIIINDDVKSLKRVDDAVSFLVDRHRPTDPRNVIYG